MAYADTSRAEAQSQGQNASAGTVFNFGSGAHVDGGWYGQTNTPVSEATAATNSPGTQGGNAVAGQSGKPNWLLIGGIGLAAVVVMVLVLKHKP